GDIAARYGGEEFSAILVGTDLDGARSKAEDIRKRVMNLGIPHSASLAADVMTVSIGVASAIPVSEDGYVELVKAADEALYKAKNKGRNCVWTADYFNA
ncbi:MAG: GGDEF domain-containing protein, partial [Acidobacteria bacterium]|nr:GGDEF domain-containing protein [Acidobacteriota bacterium]